MPAAAFVATAAPQGWHLGRWAQKSEELWEEEKLDGSEERLEFEVLRGPQTPGSRTVRLRLVGQSTEVLLVGDTVQVFNDGAYLGEYLGFWEEGGRPSPAPRALSFCSSAAEGGIRACRAETVTTETPVGISGAAAALLPGASRPRSLGHPLPLEGLTPSSPQRRAREAAVALDSSPEMARLLTLAASQGDAETVQRLLAEGRANPDAAAADGSAAPPLFPAAAAGHLAVVEALVAAGADVNVSREGQVPALLAYQQGHEDVVRALLGATFDALNGSLQSQLPSTPLGSSFLTGVSLSEDDGPIPPGMVQELNVITKRLARNSRAATVETSPPEVRRSSQALEAERMRRLYVAQALQSIEENVKGPQHQSGPPLSLTH